MIVVRFAPGVGERGARARLERRFGEEIVRIVPEQVPVDLVNFGRVRSMPVVLAGLLGALAAGILGHVLLTSVRRKSRDLAILKTLGFVRRQVRGTVGWQATVLAGIALALGLPIGVAAGRWLWTAFANQREIVPEPRAGLAAVLLAVPATIGLANLIAAVPGHAAARIRPAVMLRAE